jgi:single-strand DNA-binding protein
VWFVRRNGARLKSLPFSFYFVLTLYKIFGRILTTYQLKRNSMGMMSKHRFFMVGNVSKEPTLSMSGSGKVLARLPIAVNEKWFDKATNSYKRKSIFFNLTAFEVSICKQIEDLHIGDFVVVDGDINPDSYVDKATGEKKYVTNLIITQITTISSASFKNKTGNGMPKNVTDSMIEDVVSQPKSQYETVEDIFNDLDV